MSLMIQTMDTSITGVSHSWSPADETCEAYGTLRFGTSVRGVTVYFHRPAEIDQVIAELVALRAEMTAVPEPETVPWPTGLCGHTVTPGAWSQGFHVCRNCLTDWDRQEAQARYDRATAGEQLDRAAS